MSDVSMVEHLETGGIES